MKIPEKPLNYASKFEEKLSVKNALIFLTIFSAAATLALYELNTEPQSNLLLKNSTELNYTEGNSIGTLIIRDNSFIPNYETSNYKACIYTYGNETPLILDLRVQETSSGSNTKNMDLMIDIPEEKLGQRNYSGDLPIQRGERCPINSEPRIIVIQ